MTINSLTYDEQRLLMKKLGIKTLVRTFDDERPVSERALWTATLLSGEEKCVRLHYSSTQTGALKEFVKCLPPVML